MYFSLSFTFFIHYIKNYFHLMIYEYDHIPINSQLKCPGVFLTVWSV